MSAEYTQLLDAAIAHLETLKERGIAWVPVRRETLSSVAAPVPKSGPAIVARETPQILRSPGSVPTTSVPASERSVGSSPLTQPKNPVPSEAARSRWSRAASVTPTTWVVPKLTTASRPLPPPLPPEARSAAMAELRSQILVCSQCSHLVASRQSVVFGVGDIQAKILFVGEAPGAEEDEQGVPFVGMAGELLTKIITAMGLSRDSVFITNLLKCRPDTQGPASGNRKPSSDEMATCLPWLDRQMDLVQPLVMVALGDTAVEGLLGKGTAGISQLRGSWQTYRGIPLMPTYHPAYLLRNQALSEKRKVWEDMLQALERAGYPVSAKQRGYFLTRD